MLYFWEVSSKGKCYTLLPPSPSSSLEYSMNLGFVSAILDHGDKSHALEKNAGRHRKQSALTEIVWTSRLGGRDRERHWLSLRSLMICEGSKCTWIYLPSGLIYIKGKYILILFNGLVECVNTKLLDPPTSSVFFPKKQKRKKRVPVLQRYILMNEMI